MKINLLIILGLDIFIGALFGFCLFIITSAHLVFIDSNVATMTKVLIGAVLQVVGMSCGLPVVKWILRLNNEE